MWRLTVILLLLMAGCLQLQPDNPQEPLLDTAPDMAHAAPPLAAWTDCTTSAAIAWYPMEFFREFGPQPPFEIANIRPDIGDAILASGARNSGIDPTSPAAGHWHVTIRCEDVLAGFVGVRIEPPPWDNSGITAQFLATSLTLPNGPLLQMVAGHAQPTMLAEGRLTFDGTYLHALHHDSVHGRYETYGLVEHRQNEPPKTIRLWMMVDAYNPTSGQLQYSPAAIDLMYPSTSQTYLSHDTTGQFTHTHTAMHAPLPGLSDLVVLSVTEVKDIQLQLGPTAPHVRLDQRYEH